MQQHSRENCSQLKPKLAGLTAGQSCKKEKEEFFMAVNERGGFRPPKAESMVWKCECGKFNSVKDNKCKQCGKEKK